MKREEASFKRDGEHMTPPVLLESIPDLSVTEDRRVPLLRSGWAAVVEVKLQGAVGARHEGIMTFVGSHLQGRAAVVGYNDEVLRADFQVDDGSPETRELIEAFAAALQRRLGAQALGVAVRINELDHDYVAELFGRDRPLKAL